MTPGPSLVAVSAPVGVVAAPVGWLVRHRRSRTVPVLASR